MNFNNRFLAFWYDFIVGDDWVVAVGVVALLTAAGVLQLPVPVAAFSGNGTNS